jgi:signal transduction histidine kinase
MIERVLVNLLDNALRHTPPGGRVRIDVREAVRRVEVSVTDTGVGIGTEHLPTLFQRTSPLGRSGGRVSGGLGLLIVGRILALHECSIRVESALGQGTAFRFDVPSPSLS